MEKRLGNLYLPPDLKWGRKCIVRYTSDAEITSTYPGCRSLCCNLESDDSSVKFLKPSTPSDHGCRSPCCNSESDDSSVKFLKPSTPSDHGCRSLCCNSESDDSSVKFLKPSTPSDLEKSQRLPLKDKNDGIKETRAKLLVRLRLTAEKLKLPAAEKEIEDKLARLPPWNLRTRRAACKAPEEKGSVSQGKNPSMVPVLPPQPPAPSPPVQESQLKPKRRRGLPPPLQESQPKPKRRRGLPPPLQEEGNESQKKLRISLTREEIEEDFLIITGSKRLRRKPKQRPRKVQRVLDTFFPGLCLSNITLDKYKVPDNVDASGKR